MAKKKEIEKSEEDEFLTSFQSGFNSKEKVYEPSEKELQDSLNKMKLIDIQILKDQNTTLYQKKMDSYNKLL